MTGHTKEPWEINGCDWDEETDQTIGCEITDSEFYFVASCEGGRSSEHDNANARRIVDCVNAFAGIPDPLAFVQAARGMAEALEACQSTLQHTRAFMLEKHGTTNPAREDALASAAAKLTAFRAATGEA